MFDKNNASKNNGRTISWRNQYLYQVRDLAKYVADTLPDSIEFPVTGRKTAFEVGGSAKNFGTSVIISDGYGYPCQGKLLPKIFANGLQAEVDVFPCCLIGIASYKLGREVFAIYKINKIVESETAESFGHAEAKLVAYIKSPTQFSGSSKKYWYDNLKEEYHTIDKFVEALVAKLYTVNCTTPFYVEWFMNLKNQLSIRKRFFNNDQVSWFSSGICSAEATAADMSESFTGLYNSVVARAIELNKDEKNRIIMAVFGHYFANINEDNNIEFISDYTDVDFTKCVLVTEARLVTSNVYNNQNVFNGDRIVYTYVHNFDSTVDAKYADGNINSKYFLSDPSFVEFTKNHPAAYVSNILDRKFYSDIIYNLNPTPYVLTNRAGELILDENGEKKMVMPEPKVHPDTQTNVLLFTGSCRNFFSDVRELISHKSQKNHDETPAPIDFSALSNLTNK